MSAQKDETGSTAARVNEQLGEISLKEDRSSVEQYRQNVPAEKKQENDELALLLNLTGELKEKPERIRERFQTVSRKKRDEFRKKSKKLRDDFTREEAKTRDEFLRKMKNEREDFKKTKVDRQANAEFYNEQERNRREFQADQKDKRQEFESAMRAKSTEFDEYMREKTRDFNEQIRLYSQRYQDKLKEEKQKKDPAKSQSDARGSQQSKGGNLSEFEEMQNIPATRIGTDSKTDN